LAAPIALIRDPGYFSHGLPLPAWVGGIDRHEEPRQPARLQGVHEYPRGGTYKGSGRLFPIDEEKAVRQFRRFNSDPSVEYAQLARGRDRPVALRDNKIS